MKKKIILRICYSTMVLTSVVAINHSLEQEVFAEELSTTIQVAEAAHSEEGQTETASVVEEAVVPKVNLEQETVSPHENPEETVTTETVPPANVLPETSEESKTEPSEEIAIPETSQETPLGEQTPAVPQAEESLPDATAEAGVSNTEITSEVEKATEQGAAAPISPANQGQTEKPYTDTWTEVNKTHVVTNYFSRGGVNFEVSSHFKGGVLVGQTIKNLATGIDNTYSFSHGSASTSKYYYQDSNGEQYIRVDNSTVSYYTQAETNGNTLIGRKFIFTDQKNAGGKIEIFEVLQTTLNGAFKHFLTYNNVGTYTYNDFILGVQVDTELNGNDRIPLYAIGNGGIYITDDDLTLYNESLDGSNVYAGRWVSSSNVPSDDYVSANGQANGTLLGENMDTAIYYEKAPSIFVPGQTIEMSWQERLYTEGEDTSTVTVNYVDDQGNTVALSDVNIGIVGEAHNVAAKTIAGYTLVTTADPTGGLFGTSNQVITYTYKKNEQSSGTVIVTYVDENGNQLSISEAVSGKIGDAHAIAPKAIEGYTLVATTDATGGLFTANEQSIVYTYKANEAATSSITIKYQDENGNTIHPDTVITGKVGDLHNIAAQKIEGFILAGALDGTQGIFDSTNQTIVFTYKKAQAETVKKEQPKEQTVPLASQSNVDPIVQKTIAKAEVKAASLLPATGEATTSISTVFATILSSLGAIGLFFKHRK
ncbi:MucBP domain-containing protein [Vagococcus sp. BWB3-3]|uniref:MucBP domain-containing protein n=1 Tax=Vagococcus allomyrinae TaxID=2794353 RepID=A0A940P8D3_9ENTE|nr:MucBP domain-containing protein [Vagococcus allomyrinae]MBP1040314.1 MucBP domain-containing protein [Vagococcus allomyrinae]